jgi:hypothetical protein
MGEGAAGGDWAGQAGEWAGAQGAQACRPAPAAALPLCGLAHHPCATAPVVAASLTSSPFFLPGRLGAEPRFHLSERIPGEPAHLPPED